MNPLAELDTLGRALGGVRWVQGPGGNVSVKTDDGELWVKASGKILAEVASPEGHAKVPLALAKRALDGVANADRELFAYAPRPSLETYFHALEGRVVAHTHAVGAMLYACSTTPYVASVQPGVVAIPYVRPGRDVALAMQKVIPESASEIVVILRSHGIVAIADSAARAIELTSTFDEEARAKCGSLPAFEPLVDDYLQGAAFSVEGGYARRLPARAPKQADRARYLFPDAPVCAALVSVDRLDDAEPLAARALAALGRAAIVIDPAGRRLAVARTESQLGQTCEVLAAHDWIEDALEKMGSANYLPDDEPAKIVQMPSEQYRIRLADTER